jgi:hypothetical protein
MMKIDYNKELKKLKVKGGLLAVVGGMGLGLIMTVFQYIGKREANLEACKLIDSVIENVPNDK